MSGRARPRSLIPPSRRVVFLLTDCAESDDMVSSGSHAIAIDLDPIDRRVLVLAPRRAHFFHSANDPSGIRVYSNTYPRVMTDCRRCGARGFWAG